jgi:hypothetical protein
LFGSIATAIWLPKGGPGGAESRPCTMPDKELGRCISR